MAIAGWYPDPRDPSSEQYWDGQRWTGQQRRAGTAAPQAATQQPAAQQPAAQQPAAQQPATQAPAESPQSYQQTTVNPVWRNQPVAPQPPSSPQGGQPYGGPAAPAGMTGPSAPAGSPPNAGTPWQPGGSSPYGQSQPYGAPGQAPGQPPGPGQYGPQGHPPKKRKKVLIIAAAVVVVLVAGGLATYFLLPGSSPSITYQGKSIDSADTTLTTAEKSVATTVSKRHGVKSKDTRCYFAKPSTPASGAKKTDVDSSLRCGPVLFVDGDKASEYLSVPLTASDASGGKIMLTPSSSLDDLTPSAVAGDVTLVRPDGETAPAGDGGLSVPSPPAADKDALLAASLGPTSPPASLSKAAMVSKTTKVTLTAAGEIARYGTGTDARSAPAGQKLYAFQVAYGAGDESSDPTAAKIVIDGGSPRAIPEASGDQWDVVAVPASGTATIQLDDSGYTQTLALPDGTPGDDNITVLTRTHRTSLIGKNFAVPVTLRRGSQTVPETFRTSASFASLDFWPPIDESAHPSGADKAYLSIRLNYTYADSPGHTYGFDPALLSLKLPDGTSVPARNLAPKGKISDVFEVPGDFTSGTLVISGSENITSSIVLKVNSPVQIRVAIPSG